MLKIACSGTNTRKPNRDFVVQIDSRYPPIGGFGGLGGNGSGGGVGVGDGLGGVGLGGDGVSCMIQSRFMSSEVETSLFLSWRDKQSEISRRLSLTASLEVNASPARELDYSHCQMLVPGRTFWRSQDF